MYSLQLLKDEDDFSAADAVLAAHLHRPRYSYIALVYRSCLAILCHSTFGRCKLGDSCMAPKVILFKGHPGSGKSAIARELSTWLHWPIVDKDDVRDCLPAGIGVLAYPQVGAALSPLYKIRF